MAEPAAVRVHPAAGDVLVHMMTAVNSMASAVTELVRDVARPAWMPPQQQQHVDVAAAAARQLTTTAWTATGVDHPQHLDTTTTTTTSVSDTVAGALHYLNL